MIFYFESSPCTSSEYIPLYKFLFYTYHSDLDVLDGKYSSQ